MSLVDGLLPEADAVNDADHSSQLKRMGSGLRNMAGAGCV
jgi:hypothetical protein